MPTGVNQTLDERLDRLEVALNQTQRTLARVVALMDGDPSYRIVGVPDQLAAYIKANEDWKAATERRIMTNEDRLSGLEDGNRAIVLSRAAAYIKANEDWKAATERRIMTNEDRLSGLEDGNRAIVLSRAAAIALVIIGSLCLVVAFLLLTWLQRAG